MSGGKSEKKNMMVKKIKIIMNRKVHKRTFPHSSLAIVTLPQTGSDYPQPPHTPNLPSSFSPQRLTSRCKEMETDAPHIIGLSWRKRQTFVSLSAHIAWLSIANNQGRGLVVRGGKIRFKLCWVEWSGGMEGVCEERRWASRGLVFKELAAPPRLSDST